MIFINIIVWSYHVDRVLTSFKLYQHLEANKYFGSENEHTGTLWCWAISRHSLTTKSNIVFFSSYWTSRTWWRHQMETFSLLALCAGNSPVTGEFPAQRPVTPSFDVFFHLRLNKRLSKQQFETPSCPFWRHCNEYAGRATLFQIESCNTWQHCTG